MGSKRTRVLVVDDDRSFRESLVELLDELGYASLEAPDARVAIQTLAYERVDLALVDLRMPVLDGHLLIQELTRRGLSVPVVAMSGAGTVDDLIALKKEGAVEFLRKPFEADELEATIERVLDLAPRRPRSRKSGPATIPIDTGPAPATPVSRFRRPLQSRSTSSAESNRAHPPPPAAPTVPAPKPSPRRDPIAEFTEILDRGDYQLPAIAPIARDVQRLMDDPMPSANDIVDVVSKDPTVAVALLRTANSSMYRGGAQVTNLRTACLRLGNRRVLALAQTAIVEGLFEVPPGPLGGVLASMWKNVLVTAWTARSMAVRLKLDEPDDVYVAALVHNLGELVMLRLLADLQPVERTAPALLKRTADLLARSHEKLGRRLLTEWDMQPAAVELAGAHHRAPRAPQSRKSKTLRLLVLAAWMGACRAGFTYLPGQEDPDPGPALSHLGLDAAELDGLVAEAARHLDSTEGSDD